MSVVEPILDPGSLEAIAAGCTCPPRLNGQRGQTFIVDQRCPVHGFDVLAALMASGDPKALGIIARLLGQDPPVTRH